MFPDTQKTVSDENTVIIAIDYSLVDIDIRNEYPAQDRYLMQR